MRLGKGVLVYGDVRIGVGSLIEDGVVIGHPSPSEIELGLDLYGDALTPAELYALVGGKVEIGPRARILSGTVIYSGVRLGADFVCGHNVIIREGVEIGDRSYIKPGTEVQKFAKIGADCRIAGLVGDNSLIEDRASSFGFLTHAYREVVVSGHEPSPAPVLRRNSIVGRNSVVVGGVEVGEAAVVGAGAVVVHDVPPRSLCIGPKAIIRNGGTPQL